MDAGGAVFVDWEIDAFEILKIEGGEFIEGKQVIKMSGSIF